MAVERTRVIRRDVPADPGNAYTGEAYGKDALAFASLDPATEAAADILNTVVTEPAPANDLLPATVCSAIHRKSNIAIDSVEDRSCKMRNLWHGLIDALQRLNPKGE